MRKGRSSRRSRVSRPLVAVSLKGEALSTDVGPASSGHPSPRIVLGVPPSDPPPSIETPPPVVLETKSEARVDREAFIDIAPPRPAVESTIEPDVVRPVVEAKAPVTMPSFTKTIVGAGLLDKPAFDFEAPVALPPPPPVLEPELPKSIDEGWSTAPPPVVEAKAAPEEPAPAPVAAPDLSKTIPDPPRIEAVAKKPDLATTLVQGTPEAKKPDLAATLVRGTPEAKKPDLAATLVQGTSELAPPSAPAPVQAAAVVIEPAKTLTFGTKDPHPSTDRAIELRERREMRERLKQKRFDAKVAAADVAPSTDPDEISVPPAGDIGVEDEKFFSEGDLTVHDPPGAHADDESDYVPEKAIRKSMPHIVQRRAKLAGYVKIAVASAAFLCLVAVGSSSFRGRTKTAAKPIAAMQVATPEAAVTPKAAEPAAAPVQPAQPATPAPVAEVAPPEPKPEPAAEPTKAEDIAGDAKEELKKSRTALEKRKLAEAIEAGEKSVALDPTDGEAWLILGAAYQEKGNLADARRCYSACVKQGKTGPRQECGKMLR